jgi:molybdopterin converting factor small subunit
MAITVTIPTALRQYVDNQARMELEAPTVGEALHQLVAQYPELGKHMYTDEGKLRNFVTIYVGDEDIRYLDGEQTILRNGETVSIIPAIAGGR